MKLRQDLLASMAAQILAGLLTRDSFNPYDHPKTRDVHAKIALDYAQRVITAINSNSEQPK